ncbi:MAG: hypothetical protein GX584_00675 [Clostridiaceae bacterium]|nr:hypothetical protein [Clostridiaceae bacterium]
MSNRALPANRYEYISAISVFEISLVLISNWIILSGLIRKEPSESDRFIISGKTLVTIVKRVARMARPINIQNDILTIT